ncbi:hypothetical protein, partial [Klebsiella pneumoniae]|uniref:hypothetical protein n=2 Tax=Klebsiella pneumoniae TaxID=573 RepID=UPI002181E805
LMMSLWDALRMNMMISYQELVRTFLSSDHILSILDKTKDYPEIKRIVINRLLSGSILTGKDEEYIYSQLEKAQQSNEREKRLQAIKEYTS